MASTYAAKIALMGGAADMVAEDWLWAARERALGDKVLFTPYSTDRFGLLGDGVERLAYPDGCRSRRPIIGVAGGPLDKSWLFLRAVALGSGLISPKEARPLYGAPPLIAEKLVQGETEAALEYWNFSLRISRGVASAERLKCPMSRRRSAQAAL